MENKKFVDRMKEIIGTQYVDTIPNFLKEVFESIIKERKVQNDKIVENPLLATINIEEDGYGNSYVRYYSESGDFLSILDNNVDYVDLKYGINITEGYLIKMIKYYYDEIIKNNFPRFIEEGNNLFKSGSMEKGSEQISKTVKTYEEKKDLTGEEILDVILSNYKAFMDEKRKNKPHNINVSYDPGVGNSGPRGDKKPRGPAKPRNEEYNSRIDRIAEIVGSKEYASINHDEFIAFYYDLQKNENEETGYMLLLEPADINDRGKATIISYLSIDEYEEIKDRLEQEKSQKDMNAKVSDNEIKDEFIKMILEDAQRRKTSKMLYHTEDFKGFISRVQYYLKGGHAKGKNQHLVDSRGNLLGKKKGDER